MSSVKRSESSRRRSDFGGRTIDKRAQCCVAGLAQECGTQRSNLPVRCRSMSEDANSDTSRAEEASGLARYDKRMEEWVEAFSDQVEHAGGKLLDELASVAKSLADRLEEVADRAREKRETEKTGQ
jgi:hypothetical protein